MSQLKVICFQNMLRNDFANLKPQKLSDYRVGVLLKLIVLQQIVLSEIQKYTEIISFVIICFLKLYKENN